MLKKHGEEVAIKKITCLVTAILIVTVLCYILPNGFASDKGSSSIAPRLKGPNQKWRIAYVEGGSFFEFQLTLRAVIRGLVELGWLPKFELSNIQNTETVDLWSWLARSTNSPFIEFVEDAYYTAAWDEKKQAAVKTSLLERLNKKKDIDLVIAMGTWAGYALANHDHSVPTLVFASTDPIGAGIIKNVEDSGFDHIHARVDPERYDRQIRIFHDLIKFKKLGIVYDYDTAEGRSYAAVDTVERLGRELGFEIISCNAALTNVSLKKAEKEVFKCHEKLSPLVDAVYITEQGGGITKENLPYLLAPLIEHHIPTFSQFGSEHVKRGVLLSVSQAEFKYIGKFHADTIAKVLNGAKPRDLDQLFEEPSKIAINLKTARLIGWNPPVDVVSAADDIYPH